MTDGTSQGLFVVVAIVIFGIFVALSYTVFGSGGLSGGVTSLFEQSIEKSEVNLYGYEELPFTMRYRPVSETHMQVSKFTSDSIEYTSDGVAQTGAGAVIEDSFLELDSDYVISFDITKLSGSIANIGGHLHVSSYQDVYINGVKQDTSWTSSVPFPNDYDTHRVEIHFNTEYLHIDELGNKRGTISGDMKNPSNQPAVIVLATNRTDRYGDRVPHSARIDNIRVSKK